MGNQDKTNRQTAKFFHRWIYSRKIPKITLFRKLKGKKATILIEQANSDFVFPVKILFKTAAGPSPSTLTVTKKRQFFDIRENAEIKDIEIEDTRSLVKITVQKN